MVNKRVYAMMLSSKENAKAIQAMTDEIASGGRNLKTAYRALDAMEKIKAINDKFVNDFGNTDPGWMPDPNYKPSRNIQVAPDIEVESNG